MRNLPHILSAFYGEPWHLRGQEWKNFDVILQRVIRDGGKVEMPAREPWQVLPGPLAAFAAPGQRPVVGPVDDSGRAIVPQMEIVGSVAVVPVYGVLGRHLSMLALFCGGCDYEHIETFTQMALDEPGVRTIVYDFKSPGGNASGCGECARVIAEAGEAKATVGFANGLCCSAAYWLGSQCGALFGLDTAIVGNVGTIMAGEDNSAQWAQEGRKLELFVSDPLKGTNIDGKAWTEQDRAYWNERKDQATARIKSGVRAGRPGIKEEAMDGRWFFAGDSIGLGVVDGVAKDLVSVVEALL